MSILPNNTIVKTRNGNSFTMSKKMYKKRLVTRENFKFFLNI
jgi:hypothetical protein